MQAWATLLANLGFTVTTLSDGAATRDAILGNLRDLIATSKAGDVLAFQYSGHGTQVPDDDGDEEGGDQDGGANGTTDEAICPVDFGSGRLIVDDELRAELANLPEGVSFHQLLRLLPFGHQHARVRYPEYPTGRRRTKARFVLATDELIAAHREFRRGEGNRRPSSPENDRGAFRSRPAATRRSRSRAMVTATSPATPCGCWATARPVEPTTPSPRR